jgi:hypothetical protein
MTTAPVPHSLPACNPIAEEKDVGSHDTETDSACTNL